MTENRTDSADAEGIDHAADRRANASVPILRTESDVREEGRDTLNARVAGGFAGGKNGHEGTASVPADASRAVGRRERAADGATDATTGADATGRVSLVGAGPGHPDLLTRRAYRRLVAADVVLYDALTSAAVLDELPDRVETIDVGKRPPNRTPQNEINALLCERAARGERVVRLKGGDPCLFGRGGEEAEHLAARGVPFEIVPGVSSALAAPGVSAIPLTHREHASSVTVITGHETPEKPESALDWDALAGTVTAGGTLVILMGVSRLARNVRALSDHGVSPQTPAATIQKATWRDEKTVVAAVETIADRNERAGIEPPAVTVVGDVVSVRESVTNSLLR